MELRKIFVVGSNSFTGSHFINYILSHTDADIIGVSRSAEYSPIFLPYLYKKEMSKKFTFHQLDINKDFNSVTRLLAKEKPDVIVNYSAQGEVRNSWKWPEQWFQTNCMSVVKLANFLKGKNYLKKYVAISTPEVYGSTGEKIVENHNYFPSTPYAASKLAGDLFLFTLYKKYSFPLVVTRSANVYGIHQQLYRIIPRVIIYLKLEKKIQLHGNGKTIRSFIHIRDVADATYKVITKGKDGEVYHIAPQNGDISIKDLVKMICDMMGYNFNASTELIEENFGQDTMFSIDSTKTYKELGWELKITLKQGIQEMIEWIEENWDEIKKKPLDYVHQA